jgi:orotate phosphoribosyltransferase-like protein
MTEAKPSPWKKLTLLSKTSAKESKESDIVLKWKSFSQSNKKPTEIEKFLWDVNIHNDLSNVDNFVIKVCTVALCVLYY